MRFAFYGRVSTEDQQDPAASRGWQLSRATALIEPRGGVVMAEYFDVGQSRSLPWKRRPEAARLLDDLRNPDRGFEAVVIGEPHRAFYGSQFSLTFPLLTHHHVALWVPEVGGPVDPGSEAHDIVMSLFGGLSKGERMRIKTRVRSAMASQAATEGRFLGGRPPYGYVLADAGQHPNPSKAAIGQRLRRLEPDPTAAPIVQRIFDEYVGGAGIGSIAERLNRDAVPSPSGHDPSRNRHRASANGAWGKSAVRAIPGNPKYVGRQVWNRQRRDEELFDVDDVAAGYRTKMRWNDPSEWVWSAEQTHDPLIDAELFAAAQAQRSVGHHRKAVVKPRRNRTYCLSGMVMCGICGRRMAGAWAHDAARYRCGFPGEYGAIAAGKHPKWVYLREADVTAALDEWLLRVFDPEHVDATVAALLAAQAPDEAAVARSEAARRQLADCQERLAKYRTALEAGADVIVVTGWIKEVEATRLAAEQELAKATPRGMLTEAEVCRLVALVRDRLIGLDGASPEQRAAIYEAMGLRLTYHPTDNRLVIESRPCTQVRVGGGTRNFAPRPIVKEGPWSDLRQSHYE